VGFLFGSFVLFSIEVAFPLKLFSIVFFIGLSIALFVPTILKKVFEITFKILKNDFSFPILRNSQLIKVFPSFFLTWLFWSFGFFFLSASIYGEVLPITLAFAFPLSGTLAIVALFAPGGLGVREGLLITCMLLYKIPIEIATTISIASRLWFLIGEAVFFGLAGLLKLKSKG
jgi:hypothetical protein